MIEFNQKYSTLLNEALDRGHTAPAVFLRLCFEVMALTDAIHHDCAARLGEYGLSEGKFLLLLLLRDRPDGLSPYELAERAGVTRPTITGLLDGMERGGFVTRRASTKDRRKFLIRLTAQGQSIATAGFDEHTHWITGLFSGLTPREITALSRMLARIWQRTDIGLASSVKTSAALSSKKPKPRARAP